MNRTFARLVIVGALVAGLVASVWAADAGPKPYRLPSVDLKQRVIWGALLEPGGDVPGLAFGGQDQQGEDGAARTRLCIDGAWKAIDAELAARNPLAEEHAALVALARRQKDLAARARRLFFSGDEHAESSRAARRAVWQSQRELAERLDALAARLEADRNDDPYAARQARWARERLRGARAVAPLAADGLDAEAIRAMGRLQVELEIAAEALGAEPPPRALSPLVHDARHGLYVLFGGDHCDYLTNDTWVFDPVARRWQQRHPPSAPPPRAGHALRATGDGRIVLTGGYTYTSNTDYCGGQYRDHADGQWVYDVAADRWTGGAAGCPADARVYRTGAFHPDYYLQAPKPDAAAFRAWLAGLPANTWRRVDTPWLPELNRDWGTAVLDPDHDLILRFSGGHSAHGGTDVLHFHLATGRWELCFPVEFPLGQLYSNTSYPEGFNFNGRPWVTGHTYQSYGYDRRGHKMVFVGQTSHSYYYDPDLGDWIGRRPKPPGMSYNDCFYDLTICDSPEGLYCWTKHGSLFRHDAAAGRWEEVEPRGELPGAVVDNSTIVHDGRRNRLLLFRKPYGSEPPYSGEIVAVDLATLEVAPLPVKNRRAAARVPYLCQIRHDAEHDLLLVGGTFDEQGTRRTPAYDCAGDEWISLRLGGDDPNGPTGRNVSLGMVYDASRKLFWAVDAQSRVYVLRLDPPTADPRPMR